MISDDPQDWARDAFLSRTGPTRALVAYPDGVPLEFKAEFLHDEDRLPRWRRGELKHAERRRTRRVTAVLPGRIESIAVTADLMTDTERAENQRRHDDPGGPW
jgi:hypothetical protein